MGKKIEYYGGDFSHWNNSVTFDNAMTECEFFAHKATEGTSFTDDCFVNRASTWMDTKPCIAYHVLNNKTIKSQFDNFKHVVNEAIYRSEKGRIGYAIDVEITDFPTSTIKTKISKILEFGEYIQTVLNHRPIVYLSDMYADYVYEEIKARDWLVWIARYTHKDTLKNKKLMDMWQYTNDPYDRDIFYGTDDKLHSFLKEWT